MEKFFGSAGFALAAWMITKIGETILIIGNHSLGKINPCPNFADVKHLCRKHTKQVGNKLKTCLLPPNLGDVTIVNDHLGFKISKSFFMILDCRIIFDFNMFNLNPGTILRIYQNPIRIFPIFLFQA